MLVKEATGVHRITQFMLSKHWFREWLGVVRRQAFTWASLYQDLYCCMSSQGRSESRPEENGYYFTDATFKCNFVNATVIIKQTTSLICAGKMVHINRHSCISPKIYSASRSGSAHLNVVQDIHEVRHTNKRESVLNVFKINKYLPAMRVIMEFV